MGTLSIVSTPIGNLEDITIRAIKTLFSVDIILCEDTRRGGLLLQELRKRYASLVANPQNPKLLSYYNEIEFKRTPEVIELLEQGKAVALISDAGTPLISDPGFTLIREAVRRGVSVVSIPGPSALLVALTSSGLPSDKFMFLGYPPEKSSHRIKLFNNVLQIHRCIDSTFIFYCSPHKFQRTLEDMQGIFADIEIVVARELTKIHEEIWRGKISEALTHFSPPQGEFVLLIDFS